MVNALGVITLPTLHAAMRLKRHRLGQLLPTSAQSVLALNHECLPLMYPNRCHIQPITATPFNPTQQLLMGCELASSTTT
mmetsp:Transcript_51810/g.110044  ORF Transcript_51810/g.110044 Transcript_51810/m.110044 type:complete len:80 (+) Transcript_51810:122-361(+)